jgi:ribosome modulation factor
MSRKTKQRPPANRTIGDCMKVSEQRGKDDWLAGTPRAENPYAKEDYISRVFWVLGWNLAHAAHQEFEMKMDGKGASK